LTLRIDALDAEGRGVARNPDGKVVFVEGALPFEEVSFLSVKNKTSFEVARATTIHETSSGRVVPRCPHFGTCGGCALQHADLRTQMAAKQRGLEDNLERIGKVRAETMLPILYGPEWGYRQRARLSVRRVPKKGGVLVGFREKRSTYVADMAECPVLPPAISRLIPELKALIESLSINDRVPQVEVAAGDADTVLVFRNLLPFIPDDIEKLKGFEKTYQVHVWTQPGGPDTAKPLDGEHDLYYELPEFGVRIDFRPTEFTQVNAAVNRALVSRAIRLLDPQPGERVADLFCGLGNFSLPLARRGAEVVGFEGSSQLVNRARQNALKNNLIAQFEVVDLFKAGIGAFGPFDKLLIDPPREGAVEIVKSLPDPGEGAWPSRIVYVSCDPATLARDAGILVHTKGFRLLAAGVVNMFPHTAHVESMAVFER
jgi:23S rRNA (uracil1939-C5)-methyltransferase